MREDITRSEDTIQQKIMLDKILQILVSNIKACHVKVIQQSGIQVSSGPQKCPTYSAPATKVLTQKYILFERKERRKKTKGALK